MRSTTSSPTNLVRLKEQLKKDSLAARLVDAYMTAAAGAEQAGLRKTITDPLTN